MVTVRDRGGKAVLISAPAMFLSTPEYTSEYESVRQHMSACISQPTSAFILRKVTHVSIILSVAFSVCGVAIRA